MRIYLRRFAPDIRLLLAAYALVLLIAVRTVPLHISEILQLIAHGRHSWAGFMGWIPQAPGSAPLNYFVQFPFVSMLGATRLGARLPSLLLGLASCYLFWQVAERTRLRHPYWALAVFALLPSHYLSATEGLPFEQALFLLLLATLCFLRLLATPTLRWALSYGAMLTLCIYTERFSFLPALGYLLFLFAFVNRAHERRVIWFALPATIAPALLFVPYYLWARPQVNPRWLFAPAAPGTPSSVYLQALQELAGGGAAGYALSLLLLAGLLASVWGLFRVAPAALPRSIGIFCMLGGAVTTLLVVLGVDVWNRYLFASHQVLWAMPEMIVCYFAAFERWGQTPARRFLAAAATAVLLVLCLAGDFEYIAKPTEDLAQEAALIRPELHGDACVVFVSQGLSKPLFLVFDPGLEQRVCQNFFHRRAVLVSHAYVQSRQQENAESFFRGLNFVELKRMPAGGGQIVVMQSTGR